MDPAGILMLRSIRIVFEKLGLKPESIKFKKEEFNINNLVPALIENPKKCPVIVTMNALEDSSPHVMVATTAYKGKAFTSEPLLREQWFITCKNSYRDVISEPGIF